MTAFARLKSAGLPLRCLVLGLDAAHQQALRNLPAAARVRPVPPQIVGLVKLALEEAEVTSFAAKKLLEPVKTLASAVSEIAEANFVLAEVSSADLVAAFYLGLAHDQGKSTILLKRFDSPQADPICRLADVVLEYEPSVQGFEDLARRLKHALDAMSRSFQLDQILIGQGQSIKLDWKALGPHAFENLCCELLINEGHFNLEWLQGHELPLLGLRASDLLPPELCVFALGGGLTEKATLELLVRDLDALLPHFRRLKAARALRSSDNRLDLHLVFLWTPGADGFAVERTLLQALADRLVARGRLADLPLRLRASWIEQRRLEAWLAKHPLLLRKYFTENDGRATLPIDLERRQPLEGFYRDALRLAERAALASSTLEKRYGLDPGREWQERAYTVTHSIGNAIFPVETYLDLIRELFAEDHNAEGRRMADLALEHLEKAKVHIRKFKNIARLKKSELEPIDVLPRLQVSLAAASACGVEVSWYVADHPQALANGDLFDELIDELVANSVAWLDIAEERRIAITIRVAEDDDRSLFLHRSPEKFVWIRFEDSGPGVPAELKERIFELFFSTRPTGMGFGLAIVRKNLRDFGGDIVESGTPGRGARFDLYLPLA